MSSTLPIATSSIIAPVDPAAAARAVAAHGYPRPQLQRDEWTSLNGAWAFALDPEGAWRTPSEVLWSREIVVPYAPEAPASGVGNTDYFRVCWYRREFEAPPRREGDRLLLHFGAVDYDATVWVNDRVAAHHEGGYTPFCVDITDFLDADGPQSIVVRAEDDPQDLEKPRGKQDWERQPHGIWYPRTTGIWQTVWLEVVPPTWIESIRWTSNLERWEIGLQAWMHGEPRDRLRLHVRLLVGDTLLADDTYAVVHGEVHRRIALSDPGIDDVRNHLLWSPERPTLIAVELELWGGRGELIDRARSYTALRTVGTVGEYFALDGRPYLLRLVLDQGYWPESGLTPPSDDALRRDVELAKAMGFNGVRKHQKIADPRYLYWADQLGLLVWEEMPSAYRFTKRSIDRVVRQWLEVIDRDYSHPCIAVWVPFNESWGIPDLPAIEAQRHYVQAMYHLTRTLDPTRPVLGNDGWEQVATDLVGIHDYESDPAKVRARYQTHETGRQLLARERPAGRHLVLPGHEAEEQPIVLTEFGGIAYSPDPERGWGYQRASSPEELAERYRLLLQAVRDLPLLTGFCYTQFADTYQETNGLLYMDRTPKIPLDVIRRATRGK